MSISENDAIGTDLNGEVYIDPIDNLIDDMKHCNIKKSPLTIYIAGLWEKLTLDIVIEKYYDVESGQELLNITPPTWFHTIEQRYQKILFRLIEPFLESHLKNTQ